MSKAIVPLTQKQLLTLHGRLVSSNKFMPTLRTMDYDLQMMLQTSKQLLASDLAFFPIIQDLIVDLETAQDAIEDVLKGLDDLNQEIKK